MTRTLTTVLAVSLVLVAEARQQTPPNQQRPVFRATADLIQVDVVVVDANGTPVRGLTKEDFTLADRGKPQTISAFEEVSFERTTDTMATMFPATMKVDVASNQSSRADRLVLMVVDDLHIYRERTDRAKEITKQVINSLGPQASMALIFTSTDHSTQVTDDRSILLAAADTLKGRQSFRRPHMASDAQRASRGDAERDTLQRVTEMTNANMDSLQDFEENMTYFKTLENAARMLSADDARRKAFVVLTEGISKDLTGMFDSETTPCETTSSNPGGRNNFEPPKPCYHDVALRQMMESLRRASVAAYMIDPRGKVTSQQLARESFPSPAGLVTGTENNADSEDSIFRWNNPVRSAQHGLDLTSAATGGFALTNTDDFDAGIKRVIEDLDHYYLIGFYPVDPGGSTYRPLKVTVRDHPEWTLRFRKGYMPGGATPPPKNSDPLTALSAGVLPKSDLAMRLFAAPFPAGRLPARVDVAIEITAPTQNLKDNDNKLRDDVSYEIIVVDDKKLKVTSRTGRAAKLALRPDSMAKGPMPDNVTYQIPITINLSPGRYQLRASAISGKLSRGGSVYLDVEVPDFKKDDIAMSGVLLAYADGERVPVGRPNSSPASRVGPAGAPQAEQGYMMVPFQPALSREFSANDTIRIYCEIARKDLSAAIKVSTVVVDAANREVRSFERPMALSVSGRFETRMTLRGLAAGAYRLQLTASDGKHSSRREVGFVVR